MAARSESEVSSIRALRRRRSAQALYVNRYSHVRNEERPRKDRAYRHTRTNTSWETSSARSVSWTKRAHSEKTAAWWREKSAPIASLSPSRTAANSCSSDPIAKRACSAGI